LEGVKTAIKRCSRDRRKDREGSKETLAAAIPKICMAGYPMDPAQAKLVLSKISGLTWKVNALQGSSRFRTDIFID
jgi:hypothetical protein